MTRTLAVFAATSAEVLVSALTGIAFSWRNPATGQITYLGPTGDQIEAASESEAILALQSGHPVQLWLSPARDLRIWPREEGTVVCFDGFSSDEERFFLGQLRDLGFTYSKDAA